MEVRIGIEVIEMCRLLAISNLSSNATTAEQREIKIKLAENLSLGLFANLPSRHPHRNWVL
jgi:hypothetical protein